MAKGLGLAKYQPRPTTNRIGNQWLTDDEACAYFVGDYEEVEDKLVFPNITKYEEWDGESPLVTVTESTPTITESTPVIEKSTPISQPVNPC